MDYDDLIHKCREYEAGSSDLHDLAVSSGASGLAESTKRSMSGWDEIVEKIKESKNSP